MPDRIDLASTVIAVPADDVELARRQIRAALIAKIRTRRELALRRSVQLVRFSHVGRRW